MSSCFILENGDYTTFSDSSCGAYSYSLLLSTAKEPDLQLFYYRLFFKCFQINMMENESGLILMRKNCGKHGSW